MLSHAFGIDTNRDIFEDKVQLFSRSEKKNLFRFNGVCFPEEILTTSDLIIRLACSIS